MFLRAAEHGITKWSLFGACTGQPGISLDASRFAPYDWFLDSPFGVSVDE